MIRELKIFAQKMYSLSPSQPCSVIPCKHVSGKPQQANVAGRAVMKHFLVGAETPPTTLIHVVKEQTYDWRTNKFLLPSELPPE
jgi:hypothetical protein